MTDHVCHANRDIMIVFATKHVLRIACHASRIIRVIPASRVFTVMHVNKNVQIANLKHIVVSHKVFVKPNAKMVCTDMSAINNVYLSVKAVTDTITVPITALNVRMVYMGCTHFLISRVLRRALQIV